MKKTKVLCTLGPVSKSEETIRAMVENGMNAVRINTSHGNFEQYREIINNVRRTANIPIVMDTQGPKVRLRMPEELSVEPGDEIVVGFDPNEEVYLDADIRRELNPGDRALIDDGLFDATIEEKTGRSIRLRLKNEGILLAGKAVNFPGKVLPLSPLTDKDVQCLQFAREMNVDYIALSFTRGKDDLLACRAHLEGSSVKIIAKIENQQGVDNFGEILAHSDGIMIARGDMGVELPPQDVPLVQKKLIRACCASGQLVITATQMLQSMIENPRPTRAEISDVANAILDGSDVVMLSGETTVGKYPVDAVCMMSRIAESAEPFVDVQQPSSVSNIETAICDSVRALCRTANINKIVSATRRGRTAKLISRLRLQQPIYALTSHDTTFRELHLYFGVTPVLYENLPDSIRNATAGMYLYERGFLSQDDLVLFVSGEYHPKNNSTNTLQILSMQSIIDYCREHGVPQ